MNRIRCQSLTVILLATLAMTATARAADAQGIDPANRPIQSITIRGLHRTPEQLVRNQIRLSAGDAFDQRVVDEDIVRITYLGRFDTVRATVTPLDNGAVALTYVVQEHAALRAVLFRGNKVLSDDDLGMRVGLRPGDPVDAFLIDKGKQAIVSAYEKAGYFITSVDVDQEQLDREHVLVYKVREGPKVRIRQLKFEGHKAFTRKQLLSQIKSKAYVFVMQKGELNRDQLDQDVASLRDFYQMRGYLDAAVGRDIQLSPDQRNANVTFLIDEGEQYVVDEVEVLGNEVLPAETIRQAIPLRPGDIYSEDLVRQSTAKVRELYGKIGHIETRVEIEHKFRTGEPQVNVEIHILEGQPYVVGKTTVTGNHLTQDRVILRQLRGLRPGRPFDGSGLDETKRRLRQSPLFTDSTITVLGEPSDAVRDILVQVSERNTGKIGFGAGVSSDAGVAATFDLVQQNFDIADVPESLGEFLTGKAFRGAGQYFSLSLSPGNEVSRYSVRLVEPYLLDTDYFLDTTLFFRDDARLDYDEKRAGINVGLGQRFGDVWSAQVNFRSESIDISNIDPDSPSVVFDVDGQHSLTSVGLRVTRSTTDDNFLPTRGSKFSGSLDFFGAMGGDYDYPRISGRLSNFWTVDEDFWERKTVLSSRLEIGYIFDGGAPVFEKFYAGGHRTFRGFDYQGIGPREGEDAIGGDFLVLAGLEYNIPVYKDTLRWVFFVDAGTLSNVTELDEYRVAVGTGMRLKAPFLGQAPFAFDFAFPVVKQDYDETRVFSFDIVLPF